MFGLKRLTIRFQVLYKLESKTYFMKVRIYVLSSVRSLFTDLRTTLLFDLLQIFTRLDNLTSHFCGTTKEMACTEELLTKSSKVFFWVDGEKNTAKSK